MPTITAGGIGSGLDVEGIVASLMALERRPLDALETKKTGYEAQLSSYGKIKSAFSTFQTALQALSSTSKFEVYSATSSDDKVFTATADSKAVPGSYSIDFSQAGQQLAIADKLESVDFTNSTTSTAAAGTLKIAFADAAVNTSFEVTIDSSSDTLAGIRDAINNASDNIGVTATIVNIDSGSRLILTSDKTGTERAITLSDTSGNVSTTLNMTTVAGNAAQNAIFSIDGNTVTSQTNTVKDAIEGVDITLVAKGTAATSLTVANDVKSVTASAQAFVDAYNALRGTIDKEREGNLNGDNTLLSIENRIRRIMNTAPSNITSSFSYLSEVGITTQKGGDLKLDTTKLEAALASDYSGVAELFANDAEGYIFRLESQIDDYLDLQGIIDTKETNLDSRIDRIEDDKISWEYRLGLIEVRLRSQFGAMDALVANLQSTGSFLTQQIATLQNN